MLRGVLLAGLAIALSGCASGVTRIKACRGSPYCTSHGRCYGVPAQGCEARDAADCLASYDCKSTGACTLRKGRCQTASDDDCRKNSACRYQGHCTFDEKRGCIAVKSHDCAESVACTERGACQPENGRCVVGSSDVCAATARCKRYGQCGVSGPLPLSSREPKCSVQGDEDCRRSEACARFGLCHAVPPGGPPATGTPATGSRDRQGADGSRDRQGTDGSRDRQGADRGAPPELVCRATADADCARAEVCRNGGECRARGGFCERP